MAHAHIGAFCRVEELHARLHLYQTVWQLKRIVALYQDRVAKRWLCCDHVREDGCNRHQIQLGPAHERRGEGLTAMGSRRLKIAMLSGAVQRGLGLPPLHVC